MHRARSCYASIGGVSAFLLCAAFLSAPAKAEERCKVDEIMPAKNSKYTKDYALDVGDFPGHQIRIFELDRVFPDDKPNCEGLKRIEDVARAVTDYTDQNGTMHGYRVVTYDNADKMFGVVDGISQTTVGDDGSRKGTFTGITHIIGGTGKYLNVRGLLRDSADFDSKKGFNESHVEGEYWFEK